MKKPKHKIEWTIVEDEEAWLTSQPLAQSEERGLAGVASKAVYLREVALAAPLAVLLLFLIGGWLWRRPDPAQRTKDELQSALVQEGQSLTPTIELLGQSLENQTHQPLGSKAMAQAIVSISQEGQTVTIDKLQRLGERVMAQVIVKYPEEGKLRAYRETRFYENKGGAWQRIDPDERLIGPEKTLKIAHFTVLYRAVDADTVYETTPQLEQLYARLSDDIGLSATDAGYTIEVDAKSLQGMVNVDFPQRKITIPSPALLSAPTEIAPATLLYQAMVYPLAQLFVQDAVNRHDARWQYTFTQWFLLEKVLPLWELWQDGGPLASERDQVVQWLYENGKSGVRRHLLPAGDASLCRTYAIWQAIPLDTAIPLTCSDADQMKSPDQAPALALTWLQQIVYSNEMATGQNRTFSFTVTSETILEYIVATYGRDKIPRLVAALGEYDSPETLIPALFGVSPASFAAGWQSYLAQHYR